jgi:hypothetical protein
MTGEQQTGGYSRSARNPQFGRWAQKMKTAVIVIVVVALFVVLFIVKRAGQSSPLEAVINIPDDDPDMAAAIRKAQETLPT